MAPTKILGSVTPFVHCGRVEPPKKNSILLAIKYDWLSDKRNAKESEMIKGVMQGKTPSREYQERLRKAVEVENQVKGIPDYENRSCNLNVPKMKISDKLMGINDLAKFLEEKSPFKQSPTFDISTGISKRTSGLMPEGKAHGTAKTAKMGKSRRKAESKSEQKVDAVKSPALEGEANGYRQKMYKRKDTSLQKPEGKRQQGYVMTEGQTVSDADIKDEEAPALTSEFEVLSESGIKAEAKHESVTTEGQTVSDADLKDEENPALTSEFEVLSGRQPISVTKSLLIPVSASSSGIKAEAKHEAVPLPGTHIPFETKEELSIKEPENVETISEKKESSSSILKTEGTVHKVESSSIPSGIQGQMKPKRKSNFKRLLELTKSVAVTRSSPSSKAKSQMVTHPGHKHEDSPINAKKSISSTVREILGRMKDAKAGRIGIYGMSGIGKTTILKALNNHPETTSMFDLIIRVSVSRSWSPTQVQQEIAKRVGLRVADSRTNFEIEAENLHHALRSRKFLLLLDDVWETIDLGAMGIPDPSPENGCKIVMATRSEHVCAAMAPDWQTKVRVLLMEEAWELFRDQVGGIIESPDIQPYAQSIVAKCCGLPLSIVIIGRALAGESNIVRWKAILNDFSSANRLELQDNGPVLRGLKFSYDRLKAPEVKSCFLYCALFPKDHKFKVTELVDYFIEEGLIAGRSADARGHGVVKDLVDASLLESVDGGLSAKMHDVIRNLALWIISSEEDAPQLLAGTDVRLTQPPKEGQESTSLSSMDQVLFSRAGAGLTELPPEEEWEQTKMIFLMDNEFSKLPERPCCNRLFMCFLHRNRRLRTIPASFFECMPNLQVLNLSRTKIRSLPTSLFELTTLQVLNLRYCEGLSKLPSKVGKLIHIEVLDLWGTEIYSLPDEIGKLSSLKCLRISFYGSIDHSEYGRLPKNLISPGVISKLQALQELSIAVHPGDPRWDIDVEFVAHDLCSLNNLINLHFCFPDIKFLEIFIRGSPSWKSDCLSKFKFVMGQDIARIASRVPKNVEYHYDQEDGCLRYVNDDKIIGDEVKKVLMRATAFCLDHHCEISSLSEFGIATIRQLRFCIVRECPKISTIVDGSNGVTESVLPNLEHLSIHYLGNLRSICEGGMPLGSFIVLRTLSVHTCPNLEFVLTQSMLQHLSSLEELTVEDCASVKEVVKMEEEIVDCNVKLPKLKRLELHHLPQLVSIWNIEVSIWNESCLERVQINYSNCPKLNFLESKTEGNTNRN